MTGSGQTGDEIGKQYQHASEVDWRGSRGELGREKERCFLTEVGTTGGEPGGMDWGIGNEFASGQLLITLVYLHLR